MTEATVGHKNIELLNEAHCDIATIGNNEGMTISHDALQNLYNDANFKVICTNVIDEEGHLPHHIASSYIKEIKRNAYFICCSNGAVHTFLSSTGLDCY